MNGAPHEDWLNFITRRWPDLDLLDVVDIGCGTGQLTVELAARCRRVYGVDRSEEMLAQAAHAAIGANVSVQWLCQDIRALALPGRVHLAVACCDVLNYLSSPADLKACFDGVARQLHPGGWFCFDVLGPARIHALKGGLWHDIREDAAVLFETDVEEGTGRIRYDVHMFVLEDGDTYRRYEEHHVQQYYTLDVLRQALESAGFRAEIEGDFGREKAERADRICVVAEKVLAT
jgi:SAM-dependent methyltransferase